MIPRYLVLLAGLCTATACSKEEEPPKSDRPAPIPTTPEHRKPMSAAEIKRLEALVTKQIDGHKAALVSACQEPNEADASAKDPAKNPDALKKAAAGPSTLSVMVVFGDDGNEITREVIPASERAARLATCVGEHLPALHRACPQPQGEDQGRAIPRVTQAVP